MLIHHPILYLNRQDIAASAREQLKCVKPSSTVV